MCVDRPPPQIQNRFFHLPHAIDRFILLKMKILPDMIQLADQPSGILIRNILGSIRRSHGRPNSRFTRQTIGREFLHFMRPLF